VGGTVRVFEQKFTFEDAIEPQAFAPPLDALACVWPMAFLSGVHSSLPVVTIVNCVQTLQATTTLTATLTLTHPNPNP
jgi:hypothetical protein